MRIHHPLGAHPLGDTGPGRTWEEASELLDFNERTGAMDATAAEPADLRAELNRALQP